MIKCELYIVDKKDYSSANTALVSDLVREYGGATVSAACNGLWLDEGVVVADKVKIVTVWATHPQGARGLCLAMAAYAQAYGNTTGEKAVMVSVDGDGFIVTTRLEV